MELNLQQDQHESHVHALRAVALARVALLLLSAGLTSPATSGRGRGRARIPAGREVGGDAGSSGPSACRRRGRASLASMNASQRASSRAGRPIEAVRAPVGPLDDDGDEPADDGERSSWGRGSARRPGGRSARAPSRHAVRRRSGRASPRGRARRPRRAGRSTRGPPRAWRARRPRWRRRRRDPRGGAAPRPAAPAARGSTPPGSRARGRRDRMRGSAHQPPSRRGPPGRSRGARGRRWSHAASSPGVRGRSRRTTPRRANASTVRTSSRHDPRGRGYILPSNGSVAVARTAWSSAAASAGRSSRVPSAWSRDPPTGTRSGSPEPRSTIARARTSPASSGRHVASTRCRARSWRVRRRRNSAGRASLRGPGQRAARVRGGGRDLGVRAPGEAEEGPRRIGIAMASMAATSAGARPPSARALRAARGTPARAAPRDRAGGRRSSSETCS